MHSCTNATTTSTFVAVSILASISNLFCRNSLKKTKGDSSLFILTITNKLFEWATQVNTWLQDKNDKFIVVLFNEVFDSRF
eukprot:m.342147 g.342147  ORF g.342147 m.342147 type:complete len:81 (+) comp21024_c0_seq1:865-1107(+)